MLCGIFGNVERFTVRHVARRVPAMVPSGGYVGVLWVAGWAAVSNEQLPHQHGEWSVARVNVVDSDGDTIEDFGTVRIWAMEGRAVGIEIEGVVTGTRVVAVLDEGRGRRDRVNLQSVEVREAIEAASRDDGLPVPFPQVRGETE
jgi:hypothetical protein